MDGPMARRPGRGSFRWMAQTPEVRSVGSAPSALNGQPRPLDGRPPAPVVRIVGQAVAPLDGRPRR